MFGACISSGMGILDACRVAGTFMGFSEQVLFGVGPKKVYADFFGILTSVEGAAYDRLERELENQADGNIPSGFLSFLMKQLGQISESLYWTMTV